MTTEIQNVTIIDAASDTQVVNAAPVSSVEMVESVVAVAPQTVAVETNDSAPSADALPIQFTDAAAKRVKELIAEEENPDLKLRVYVTGGGCSGFQYGFTFDEKTNPGDMEIVKNEVAMVVDPMSLQYLVGGEVDFVSGLEGSRFLVTNPNATTTCGCGSSFSI